MNKNIVAEEGWSESATRVWKERYCWKRLNGTQETILETISRVAEAIGDAEISFGGDDLSVNKWIKSFEFLMANHYFLPNSPCLANAGRPKNSGKSLSACYVLPVHDSRKSIMEAISMAVEIHSSGGGTGFDFSELRENGSATRAGSASGPISFMKIFDAATQEIKQAGLRRGANMGVLRCDHPDIEQFINAKRILKNIIHPSDCVCQRCTDPTDRQLKTQDGSRIEELCELYNFNISVAITDDFMQAVEYNSDWHLLSRSPYNASGEIVRTIKARELWDKIIENAWSSGDPGLLFVTRANNSRSNPIPKIEQLKTTNPCGEVWLGEYDSCNLGSLNLAMYVDISGGIMSNPWYNFKREILATHVEWAVRFLDNMIEASPYSIPEIEVKTKSLRRIGLGVMGWADTLHLLHIPYDSEEAVKLAKEVMKFISETADMASTQLAKLRGPFPLWDKSIYANDDKPLRNATRTIIAPTGSISILNDCMYGIEPIYALETVHDNNLGRVMDVKNRIFTEAMNREWVSATTETFQNMLLRLEQHISETGSLKGFVDCPESLKHFRGAYDVSPDWHVRMQAAFQLYTDNSVSKTINLPDSATIRDVRKCYELAWDLGCKGITIYRDGCKANQVLNIKGKMTAPSSSPISVLPVRMREPVGLHRPQELKGSTMRLETPLGTLFVTVNVTEFEGQIIPVEVFCNMGKAGSDICADAEALGRLISMILRQPYYDGEKPVDRVDKVLHQIENIGGRGQVGIGANRVRSMPEAIALVLRTKFSSMLLSTEVESATSEHMISVRKGHMDMCSKCGSATLVRSEGCCTCYACGYSEC